MIPLYFGTFDRVEEGVHVPSRKGSVEWNSSKSILHFVIHIRWSMQEFKKGGRFFVQLVENLFVQSIEIVIQLVKGKLGAFDDQSRNKFLVRGKLARVQLFQ